MEKELSVSKSKLKWAKYRLEWAKRELEEMKHKLNEAKHKAIDLEQEVNGLHANEVDLIVKMEFLKGEVKRASDEARGQGIKAGFKIFC